MNVPHRLIHFSLVSLFALVLSCFGSFDAHAEMTLKKLQDIQKTVHSFYEDGPTLPSINGHQLKNPMSRRFCRNDCLR